MCFARKENLFFASKYILTEMRTLYNGFNRYFVFINLTLVDHTYLPTAKSNSFFMQTFSFTQKCFSNFLVTLNFLKIVVIYLFINFGSLLYESIF